MLRKKKSGPEGPSCLLIRSLKLLEIRDHNLCGVALDIVLSGVLAVGKFAFDVEALALLSRLHASAVKV